ncbi:hypothetical protein ACWD4O_44100 [Streptomyces sp. NPDC002623]
MSSTWRALDDMTIGPAEHRSASDVDAQLDPARETANHPGTLDRSHFSYLDPLLAVPAMNPHRPGHVGHNKAAQISPAREKNTTTIENEYSLFQW